jgi:4-amino-4-deoxy-L-arabinose transferase-like glycosyltransferase
MSQIVSTTIARSRLLVPILLFVFAGLAFSSVRTKSATWDETNYFGMGDYLLKQRRWDVPSSVIHPPLAYYLDSIPLLWEPLDRSVWMYAQTTRDLPFLGGADTGRGRALLSSPLNTNDRLLNRARFMVILQAVLLGYAVYRFAAALYGITAGLLALVFFTFSPEMLSHGALITPDMTLTLFCFTTLMLFRQSLVHNRRIDHILAGVSLGLALLSKFPAALLLPIEAIVLVFSARQGRRPPLRQLTISWACAASVFLLAYGFDPRPYLQGLTIQGTQEGHWSFLLGELSKEGWWYYLIVAFVLKTPVPVLLGLALAVIQLYSKGRRGEIGIDDLILWLPTLAFVLFFSIALRSIGLRYILPIYPFVFVLAAGAFLRLRNAAYVLILPLIWYVGAAAMSWPHYLAYFNELGGGSANGYRHLVDSNLDWGQELKDLKAYMDSRGIDRVYLSYFGSDSPERYGIKYDWLPSFELKNPNPQQSSVNIPRQSYVAISATNLQGVYMEPQTQFRWLDRLTPVARLGHSMFVYYIE